MPLIQEIWVIDKAGVILFNLQLAGETLQRELLGGFLSALELFTGHLEKADLKSVIMGNTRFSLGPLGFADMILAVRTDSTIPEKKVNKILLDLREKVKKYFSKKGRANSAGQELTNIGFSLEFDDEISEIFTSLQ